MVSGAWPVTVPTHHVVVRVSPHTRAVRPSEHDPGRVNDNLSALPQYWGRADAPHPTIFI